MNSKYIADHYEKLLWPILLDKLLGKPEKLILDCLIILSKMNIVSDPGILIPELLS